MSSDLIWVPYFGPTTNYSNAPSVGQPVHGRNHALKSCQVYYCSVCGERTGVRHCWYLHKCHQGAVPLLSLEQTRRAYCSVVGPQSAFIKCCRTMRKWSWHKRRCSCTTAVLAAWDDLSLDQQHLVTSATLTVEQVHAASFKPALPIVVDNRACSKLEKEQEACQSCVKVGSSKMSLFKLVGIENNL